MCSLEDYIPDRGSFRAVFRVLYIYIKQSREDFHSFFTSLSACDDLSSDSNLKLIY